MVQRDRPIRVWGTAEPGEEVKVSLASGTNSPQTGAVVSLKATGTADKDGRWVVELPALRSGDGLEFTVSGQPLPGSSGVASRNTIKLKNVIVGDIWLCGGQSNMERPLESTLGGWGDVYKAQFPKMRWIKIRHTIAADPQEAVPLAFGWVVCSPIPHRASGVAFYFAREIHQRTGVPIGFIEDAWEGTGIEPWTPAEGAEFAPSLKGTYAGQRKLAAQSKTLSEKSVSCMYNAMIHPLARFPIKGAIWYQGESNWTDSSDTYCDKMRAMIGGWRKQWGVGDFPFYFVQLANFREQKNSPETPAGGDGGARVRAAQTKALAITNTGMAVSIDIGEGNDIHPKNKYDVGVRLARWALVRDYGQKDLVVSGPLFKNMKAEGAKIRLSFDYVGTGLIIGKKNGRDPAVEDKEGRLARFAIAGSDKQWVWADAVIDADGKSVVVSSPEVKTPVAVRYAYSQNPEGANLYNREGLPASPFRTDNW